MSSASSDCGSPKAKLEKITGYPRRYSTGNSFIQNTQIPKPITPPTPNHLRVSIGSCHDFCKYGTKHHIKITKSKPPLAATATTTTSKRDDENAAKVVHDERLSSSSLSSSDKNNRGKKVNLATAKVVPVSARKQQPTEVKQKQKQKQKPMKSGTFETNHKFSYQAAEKQPNRKTFLKSSSTVGVNRNDARKDKINRRSSLPVPSSSASVKAPTAKSGPKRVISKLEIKNGVKKSETEKTRNTKNMPYEKVIHVIEPKDDRENRNECDFALSPRPNQNREVGSAEEDHENRNECDLALSPRSNQSQKMDAAEEDHENLNECNLALLSPGSNQNKEMDSVAEDHENLNVCNLALSPGSNQNQEMDSIEDQENQNECNLSLSPSLNQNQEMDSAAENMTGGAVMVSEVQTDSSPRKMEFDRGEEVEIQNGNGDPMVKGLRRSVSYGEVMVHMNNDDPLAGVFGRGAKERSCTNSGLTNFVIEETACKLVETRKSKVMALIGAFESVINVQDPGSSTSP